MEVNNDCADDQCYDECHLKNFIFNRDWSGHSSRKEKKVVQETDYYADEFGNVLAKNQDEAAKSLEKGGYKTEPTRKEGEGTIFKDVTTKSGKKVDVRLMKGGKDGRRSVTNHPGTNSGKTLNGKATSNKNNYHFPQF